MAILVDPANVPGKPAADSGAVGLVLQEIFGDHPDRRLNANIGTTEPGGKSKAHSHAWEQVNYILAGEGLYQNGKDPPIRVSAGMVLHIPANELHWFEAGGEAFVTLGVLGPM